jgi:hypothetical protein
MSLLSPSAAQENAALNTAILERGIFYYPAGLHYGNPDAGVNCDRCRRTGIPACIGFERYDYCLACVDAVVAAAPAGAWRPRMGSRPAVATYMAQDIFLPPSSQPVVTAMAQTLMVQDMFMRPPATRMMDNLFNRGQGQGR